MNEFQDKSIYAAVERAVWQAIAEMERKGIDIKSMSWFPSSRKNSTVKTSKRKTS